MTLRLFKFYVTIVLLTFISNVFSQDKTPDYYKTFTDDGAWCWFSDPRAVYVEGKTKQIISGWVTTDGSIVVGSYNMVTGEIKHYTLRSKFERDDHDNPSFLVLPDKKIMVFFSAHSNRADGDSVPTTWTYVTKKAEDITQWEAPLGLTKNVKGPRAFCYSNPVMLSAEKNRIYLFWRGADWKPTFSYTDDRGKTWADAKTLVSSNANNFNRPYMKVYSNGIDEIHFAFTDGHPREEALNSIYYMKYKGGKFYKANGQQIGSMTELPVTHEKCDIVYNSPEYYKKTQNGVRAWIWDIALDKSGNPVLAYTRLPQESYHVYYYAHWNGSEWEDNKVCNAGSSFPRQQLKKEDAISEPHYSGGINIDHENANVVYLSRPVNDIFEIFKYTTNNGGKNWTIDTITWKSRKDNVRPFAIRGMNDQQSSQILWMENDYYPHYTNFKCSIKMQIKREKPSDKLASKEISEVMTRVAHWQMETPLRWELADWTNGALYAGMVEYAKATADSASFKWLLNLGNEMQWDRNPSNNPKMRYHADDYCVGQLYSEMYRIYKNKKMIRPMESYFDYMIKNPSTRSLEFNWKMDTYPTERWSWCDALFMGPTVWAKLANDCKKTAFRDFMYDEYKATYDHLYDKEEHLFNRDDSYLNKREANGKKIFWGRGNGWVVAGLPIIIRELPADYANKKFFETLFVEMTERIAGLQGKDGFWRASLLDPDSYPNPETSSSAFFVYSIAWGINNGYLDAKKYRPVVEKGWKALVSAVYPNGKLGWVQPIGADPKKATQEMTEVYGVGAFLLAGVEVSKMYK